MLAPHVRRLPCEPGIGGERTAEPDEQQVLHPTRSCDQHDAGNEGAQDVDDEEPTRKHRRDESPFQREASRSADSGGEGDDEDGDHGCLISR